MQKKKIRLKEKQIEKAKEIEREAMKDMEFFPEDKGDEQRRFRNMMEELREKGLLTEDEERQIFGEGGHLEREKMPLRVKGEYRESPKLRRSSLQRRLGRTAAMIIMVFAGIFAACMTSEANRRTVMNAVSGWMGGSARVTVENDVGHADRSVSEDEARMTIGEELDVPVPYLSYKPGNMAFEEYELFSEAGCAMMHYSLDGSSLTLQIVADKNRKMGAGTLKGKPATTVEMYWGKAVAEVYREENPGEASPTLSARWKYENTYYQLVVNMEWEEFEKILKNIQY